METTKVLASGLIPAMLDKQVEYDQQRHQAKPVQRSSRCPVDPERKIILELCESVDSDDILTTWYCTSNPRKISSIFKH